jgi:hypothetical protein
MVWRDTAEICFVQAPTALLLLLLFSSCLKSKTKLYSVLLLLRLSDGTQESLYRLGTQWYGHSTSGNLKTTGLKMKHKRRKGNWGYRSVPVWSYSEAKEDTSLHFTGRKNSWKEISVECTRWMFWRSLQSLARDVTPGIKRKTHYGHALPTFHHGALSVVI